ncbi:type II secretion system F family protein [Knoellia sp. p5-6-4]|uniref:type II secretion system F family protein n=1 Tax=unclassified Knoellia TaxID=2618719 RepID=UPI0023DBC5D1|nr:type II secretion system F family protein [Knoellia sp. p5-6-4]MDF2146408.1 type II secretion system F family protein [Knoellia sp. p5-6-4]
MAAALFAIALAAPASTAVQDPGTASISSTKFAAGTFTGVLTFRAGQSAVSIDPKSLTASVQGKTYPVTIQPVAQAKRATMLVVDTSGSMGEAGMATVRSSVAAFLADVPQDVSVGLVSFAATAGVDVPPTKDRARVQKAVNALRSRGETTLYDGVALAAAGLAGYDERSLLLLSDGGDTRSTTATRVSATAALQRNGVRAEVIGFKTADSDNTVLKAFAAAGGGSVAAAGDDDEVRLAFRAAAKALDSQVTINFTPDSAVRSKQVVTVSGTASKQPFRAQATVDFGAAPVVTTPVPSQTATLSPDGDDSTVISAAPRQQGMPLQLLIALVTTGLGLLGVGAALAAPLFTSNRKQRVEGIERYVAPALKAAPDKERAVNPQAISASLVSLGDKVMSGRESTSKTMALIERADLPLRAGEWWVLRIISVVVGTALFFMLLRGGLGMTLVALGVGAMLGYLLPAVVLRFLARRRCKKFEAQLPDVLALVASSLSTGFSLLQALDAVAKDAAQPAAKEFARALAETRIGADVGDALDHMSERMASESMRWTSMAIRIQREVGGNLAETLRTTAKTIREREELHRHVRALSAEGRLSSYILIGLPIGMFFYMLKANHDYISLLWTDPMGWAMTGAMLVSLAIGIAWMRKVVEVEV